MSRFQLLLGILSILFISSCKQDPWKINLSEKGPEVEINRFDLAFFNPSPQAFADSLPALMAEYPMFFPPSMPDTFWVDLRSDSLIVELADASKQKFDNLDFLEDDLANLFDRCAYYFPSFERPKVYTYISNMDTDYPIVVADKMIFIALDTYLGKDFPAYSFLYRYQQEDRDPRYITVDVANKLADFYLGPCQGCYNLLDYLVYDGKRMLLTEALIPDTPDSIRFKFTSSELNWVESNEYQMWEYLINKDLLFSEDQKTVNRFLGQAPFTKFYTDEDKGSPGQAGRWIGWRMLTEYMEKEDASLNQIITADAKTVLAKSAYKPRP